MCGINQDLSMKTKGARWIWPHENESPFSVQVGQRVPEYDSECACSDSLCELDVSLDFFHDSRSCRIHSYHLMQSAHASTSLRDRLTECAIKNGLNVEASRRCSSSHGSGSAGSLGRFRCQVRAGSRAKEQSEHSTAGFATP